MTSPRPPRLLPLLALTALACKVTPAPIVVTTPPPVPKPKAPEPVPTIVLEHIGSEAVEYPPDVYSLDGRYVGYDNEDYCSIYDEGTYSGQITEEQAETRGIPYPCGDWISADDAIKVSRDGLTELTITDDDNFLVQRGESKIVIPCDDCSTVFWTMGPAGNRFASADEDGTIRVWDVADGTVAHTFDVETVAPDWSDEHFIELAWPEPDALYMLVALKVEELPSCYDLSDEEVEEGVECWDDYDGVRRELNLLRWDEAGGLRIEEELEHYDASESAFLDPVSGCVFYQDGESDDRTGMWGVWQGCSIDYQIYDDDDGYDDGYDEYREEEEEYYWLAAAEPLLIREWSCSGCWPFEGGLEAIAVPSLDEFERTAPELTRTWECDVHGAGDDGELQASCMHCASPPDYDPWEDELPDEELPECTFSPEPSADCDVESLSPDGRWRIVACDTDDGVTTTMVTGDGRHTQLLARGEDDPHYEWTRESHLLVEEEASVVLRSAKDGATAARFDGARLVPTVMGLQHGLFVVAAPGKLTVVRSKDRKHIGELKVARKAVASVAAIDEKTERVAFFTGDEVHIARLEEPTVDTRIAADDIEYLAFAQDGKRLFAGVDETAATDAWTIGGEPLEVPEYLESPMGYLDPTWRWATEYGDEWTRSIDGLELDIDPDGALLADVGLYTGEPRQLHDQVFLAGDDALCSPLVVASDHPGVFERPNLVADFFAGKPMPTEIELPVDHPALESRCD